MCLHVSVVVFLFSCWSFDCFDCFLPLLLTFVMNSNMIQPLLLNEKLIYSFLCTMCHCYMVCVSDELQLQQNWKMDFVVFYVKYCFPSNFQLISLPHFPSFPQYFIWLFRLLNVSNCSSFPPLHWEMIDYI